MKNPLILLAILIAAPLSSLISVIIDYFSMTESLREEYYEYNHPFGDFAVVAIGSIPVYLIIGIPVTLIIDLLTKKIGVTTTYKVYLLKFFLYSLSSIGLASLLPSNEIEAYGFIALFVLTYFHVLFYLRLRYLK
ncbi:MAG TPA: hypothetical protein VEY70_08170 [Metabacillus sp.]|nr:hypothetical protein [Metabacillus sp.]